MRRVDEPRYRKGARHGDAREGVVLTFDSPGGADRALETLALPRRENLLVLEDAATVTLDEGRRVRVRQTRDVPAGRGAGWGASLGLLAGAVLATPLGGALLGARLSDAGLDNRWMQEVAARVPPGASTLFLIITHADRERALAELERIGGGARLLHTTLDDGVAVEIRDALRERRGPSAEASS